MFRCADALSGAGTREVFFALNGEVRSVQIEDRSAAIEKVSREKATSEPGSVGSPMVSREHSFARGESVADWTACRAVSSSRSVSRRALTSRSATRLLVSEAFTRLASRF